MKKIVAIVLMITVMLALAVPAVSAAEINTYERQLIDYLATERQVGKWKYFFPKNYITMAENFYLSYDLTKEQYDQIIPQLDKGYETMKKYEAPLGKSVMNLFDLMSWDDKRIMLRCAQAAGKIVGLTITYDAEKNLLSAVDANGKIWLSNEPIVKTTGGEQDNMMWIYIVSAAALLVLSAGAVVVLKKRKESI